MPKYVPNHSEEYLLDSYQVLLKFIQCSDIDNENELLARLNALRVRPLEVCEQCASQKTARRKLQKKLTEKNREIKDLRNRVAILENPRAGMTKFRPPEPTLDERELDPEDVQDFAHDVQNGAFFNHRRKF